MTLPEHIIIWGGGRWAKNYLNAVQDIETWGANIHILTSNPEISKSFSKPIYHHDSSKTLPKSALISSLIVNHNNKHKDAIAYALKHKHNILCEKPLMVEQYQLSEAKELSNKSSLVFWESMLPCYCSYFKTIKIMSKDCEKIDLIWYDKPGEIKDSLKKRHDKNIRYIDDVMPHALSIARILFDKPQQLINIEEYSTNEDQGLFRLNYGNIIVSCQCSRVAKKRVRKLAGYKSQDQVFNLDFTEEPGKLITAYGKSINETLDSQIQHSIMRSQSTNLRPIHMQIYDFFHQNKKLYWPTRQNYSIHEINSIPRKSLNSLW